MSEERQRGAAPIAEGDVLDTTEAGGLILRGGMLRGVGFGAGIVLSLIGIIFVTRELGPERFGRFQTILNLLIVVQSVTDVGMATLGVREFSQRAGADRAHFMRVLLGLRLVLTVIGVVVATGIALAAGYSTALIVGTLLGGLGLVLTVAQTTLAIPIGVQLRLGVVTALDVTRQGLTATMYVVLALAGAGILPFLAVVVPVQLILLLWTMGLVRGTVSLRPSADVIAWRGLLTQSVSFALAIAVGTIYQYIAQVLTSFVTSEFETGLFSASFRTYVVVTAVPGVLVATAFPLLSRAARDDRARLAYALRKLTDTMAIIGVTLSLAMILGAPTIIRVIAGDSYSDAAPVLRVHGVALVLAFAITTWGFGLLSMHRHRPMIIANGLAFIATTSGVLLLTPSHGAVGTAWASVIGESVLAVGYLVALRATAPELRPDPRIPGLALLLGGVVGGAVALSGVPSLVAAIIGPAAFLVVVVAAGLVPRELIDVLPPPLRSRLRGSG